MVVLERALLEAETSGRHVRALHASPPGRPPSGFPASPGFPAPEQAQFAAQELLEKALFQRTTNTPVWATAMAREGDAGQVLVEAADDAGLVVVGRRLHGTLLGGLLGSTTGYVLHHATCPVMVVPPSTGPGPFGRVVVGVDGTPSSLSALRWALAAAERYACPLLAVHAVHLTPSPVRIPAELIFSDYADATRSWLEALVAEEAGDRQGCSTQVLEGVASAALLAAAGPDELLVVGSRGRSGFAGLVLGSVATQCTQHSRGTVVVVHADEQRLP